VKPNFLANRGRAMQRAVLPEVEAENTVENQCVLAVREGLLASLSTLLTDLRLTLPLFVLSPEQAMHCLPHPKRNLHPHPPEECQHDSDPNQVIEHVGVGKHLSEENQGKQEREGENSGPEKEGDEGDEYSPPERDPWLRSAEITATTLGADFGASRIHVQPWAELDVIAFAAKVAEQGLTSGDSIAVVAVLHVSSRKRPLLDILGADPYG
jgi:hypothetical protein